MLTEKTWHVPAMRSNQRAVEAVLQRTSGKSSGITD
jgi:hypothetical protein